MTIEEILELEKQMVLTGDKKFTNFYANAAGASHLLMRFVKSKTYFERDIIFATFLSSAVTNHTLAFFSTLRKHEIQSKLLLRYCLEAGVNASYSITNPPEEHFFKRNIDGTLETLQNSKSYDWIEKNYPEESKHIKKIKDDINRNSSHSNVLNGMNNVSLDKDWIMPNFFDKVEDKFIKINLLEVAEVSILLMQTIFKVNETEKQLTFCDNFVEELKVLKEENNQLNNLLKSDFPSPDNKG